MGEGANPARIIEGDPAEPAEPGETSCVRPRQVGTAASADAPLTRSDFLTLAESARNPDARAIESEAAVIATRLGLLREDNRHRFDAFNSLVGYVYPTASIDRGVTCTLWCNWLFFFDDVHDEDLSASHDLARVRDQMEHYLGLLLGAVASTAPGPLERLTLEFRARALEAAGRPWLLRFCELVDAYLFRGVLPAVENWRSSRVPSLDEYLEQREHDSAVMTAIDLMEVANGISIPDETRNSPDMLRARRACTRTIACFNDIVSYPKEVIRHRNPNNLVHVLMTERGISLTAALRQATDIVNEAAYDLFRTAGALQALHPDSTDPVRRYLTAMREWQRGNIDSSLEGERYASRWSPLVELLRPGSSR